MDPTSVRQLRRPYLVVLGLLLALLLLVRFTGLRAPGTDLATSILATATQVVDALIGGVVASLGIALLLIVVFPSPEQHDAVTVMPARDIGRFIRTEAGDTREWAIRARTAVYFRARTIRWLADCAHRNHRVVDVRVVLMDPRDEDLRRRHLRTRPQNSRAGRWDEKRVALETCASILTCALYARRHPQLQISIRLSPSLWIVSLDISSRHAVVAGPQDGHPAIAYSTASEFFDSFRAEFTASFDAGQPLDFADTTEISRALAALGLSAVVTADEDLVEIRRMIDDPERSNQYR
jgi:hypothetical protein